MRRMPLLLAAVLPVVLLVPLLTACGTTADPNAAVVGDRPVTIEAVEDLVEDATFVEAVLSSRVPPDGSSIPGDVARSTLLFEVQRAALLNELERWGLNLTPPRGRAASTELEQVLAGANAPAGRLRPSTRETLTEFLAAAAVLDRRLASLSTEDPDDLALVYEGAPALWDRVCVTVVQVPADADAAARRLVDREVDLARWPDEAPGTSLVADPEEGCIPLARLPEPLAEAVEVADEGAVVGPVVVDGGTDPVAYWFRLERRERLSQKAAGDELVELATTVSQRGATAWIGVLLLDDVWVNPQFGTGVEVGDGGRLVIGRPEAPPATVGPPAADRGAPAPATPAG